MLSYIYSLTQRREACEGSKSKVLFLSVSLLQVDWTFLVSVSMSPWTTL